MKDWRTGEHQDWLKRQEEHMKPEPEPNWRSLYEHLSDEYAVVKTELVHLEARHKALWSLVGRMKDTLKRNGLEVGD